MTTTLLEAHRRFAAALDDLRRQYVNEFDRWLRAGASQQEADEKIAAARIRFSDEFIDRQAPAIIRDLNRDSEHDILHALRSFEARPAPLARPIASPRLWQVSVWRTALAAAFGAIAAVILLALQPIDDPLTREAVIRLLIVAAFVGALGAAIGVTVVAAPPLDTLIARMGISGLPLRIARKLGAVFALLRAGSLIILSAVLIGGLFTVIAWLLGGSQPLHVLIGLIALIGILTARFNGPDPANPDRDTLRRQLTARLDAELKTDANVWAVLSAALVLKRDDFGVRFTTDLREITTIILARRAQHEAGEDILQVIEQYLGLPSGADASHARSSASEFIWKSEHAHDYETFGAVHSGDLVSVSSQPLYIEDGSGEKRVSRKGLVTRKR